MAHDPFGGASTLFSGLPPGLCSRRPRYVHPIIKQLLQHGTDGVVEGVCGRDETSVGIHEVQTQCG